MMVTNLILMLPLFHSFWNVIFYHRFFFFLLFMKINLIKHYVLLDFLSLMACLLKFFCKMLSFSHLYILIFIFTFFKNPSYLLIFVFVFNCTLHYLFAYLLVLSERKLNLLFNPLQNYFINLYVKNKLPKFVYFFNYFYLFCLFYLRSFFVKKERPLIFVLFLLIFLINLYTPNLIFHVFAAIHFFYFLSVFGIQLMSLDNIGSFFSEILLEYPQCSFSLGFQVFLTKGKLSPRVFVRHAFTRIAMGLFVGKTNMTATGRASLICGLVGGAGYLYNEQQNRWSVESMHDKRLDLEKSMHDKRLELEKSMHDEKMALEAKKLDFEKERWEQEKKNKSWFSRK